MATVLRVRRKRTSDPAESLVFSSSKKARTADGETTAGSGGGSAAASKTPTTAVGESGDDVKKVFKFAGTVGKKDEPIAQQIEDAIKKATQPPVVTSAKPTKPSAKSSKSGRSSKSKSKSREKAPRSVQQKSAQTLRRFQVLSSCRGLDLNELDTASQNPTPKKAAPVKRTPSKLKLWNRMRKSSQTSAESPSAEDEAKKRFCLYDVTQEDGVVTTNSQSQATCKSPDKKSPPANPDVILCNSVQMVREKLVIDDKTKESDYVYDLYYIEEGAVDLNGALSMGGAEQELLMEFFTPQEEELEETYEDDSDSNDEGNWRNDYPEDEPDKRHPDLFDELIDDYCYGDQSSDEDFGQYQNVKKKTGKRALNYNAYGSDDDLGSYS